MKFLAGLLGAGLLGATVVGSGGAYAAAPTIQAVSVDGYQLAVQGSNWGSSVRVVFTLALGANTYGVELRTTKEGTFEVGAKKLNLCHGSRYWSRDFVGNEADGPIGDPVCGSKPKTSRLVVLSGKAVTVKVTTVTRVAHRSTTVIRRGNAVYLWERGATSPKFMPTVPEKYFDIIGAGQAARPGCRTSKCAQGFWWEWIGMKPGRTYIALTPWCNGQACPENFIVAIPVRIRK